MSFKLKDIVNENDRFSTDLFISTQVPLINDDQHDNLHFRFNQEKMNEQKVKDFLESCNNNENQIKQNVELLPLDIDNKSKSKHNIKFDLLQFFFNKIKQFQLTKHDIFMIILNILMIIILFKVYSLKRSPRKVSINVEEILLMKKGEKFGGLGGEDEYNDAEIADLNFNDTITSIAASQSFDLTGELILLSFRFSYSNGKKGRKYGGFGFHPHAKDLNTFELNPGEHIDQIIIYEGYRNISNDYLRGNLTHLIVGIYLKTNHDNNMMYGSKNGLEKIESPKNYFLAFPRGKAVGYIDSISFIWYKYSLKNSTINEEYH